jgi:hypothetical protein
MNSKKNKTAKFLKEEKIWNLKNLLKIILLFEI